MSAAVARRGFTLVELTVALPLAILVAALAAVILVRQAQHVRTSESRSGAVRELRHARLTMETDLASLNAEDVVSVADSLIEFRAHLGIARSCAVDPTGSVTVTIADADRLWLAGLRAGDIITLWRGGRSPTARPTSVRTTVLATATSTGRGSCGADTNQARWNIPIAGVGPGTFLVGTPARLQRLTRYSHYRSGTHWWLGRRTRDAHTWDGVQPLAGPLQSYAKRGMRVHLVNAMGSITSATDSAAALVVKLHAPRTVSMTPVAADESVHFEIAMRGAAASARAVPSP
ncbi:MAG TPA: hypothetical protein VGE27_16160 [Gemmatimonas sp.]|uniref:hypothetical protein n=1 Tax=Gemmatimonas sp. TaxID=1962908 RepID=UPI002EDBA25A